MLRAGLWHRGQLRQVSVDAPPPGQDWSIQVPTTPEGVWWEVKSIVAQLVTSAAVANRQVRWLFFAGQTDLGSRVASAYVVAASPTSVAAGTSRIYAAFQGGPNVGAASDLTGLPIDTRVQAGHYIGSLT